MNTCMKNFDLRFINTIPFWRGFLFRTYKPCCETATMYHICMLSFTFWLQFTIFEYGTKSVGFFLVWWFYLDHKKHADSSTIPSIAHSQSENKIRAKAYWIALRAPFQIRRDDFVPNGQQIKIPITFYESFHNYWLFRHF